MARRSTAQKTIDERAFPVRIKIAVPQGGLGNRSDDLTQWLNHHVGRGQYATHGASERGIDAIGIYLRDIERAHALVKAFPDLALADGTTSVTYSSPEQNFSWHSSELLGVCNLYSMTKGQDAIRQLAQALNDQTGNLPPLPSIFPDGEAPVVTQQDNGRTLSMMRWGMPSPAFALKSRKTDSGITNVRNTKSPHWQRWLTVEHRCLVPFTSFSEYDKQPGKAAEPVWFALDESRPVAFFAGIWTQWTSVRKLKEGETTNNLFGFLTTDANAEVKAIHPKAMPVILSSEDELTTWLTAPAHVALTLQRPLADGFLQIVARGDKADDA